MIGAKGFLDLACLNICTSFKKKLGEGYEREVLPCKSLPVGSEFLQKPLSSDQVKFLLPQLRVKAP